MSARRKLGWVGVAAALGLVVQACVAVPVRERPHYASEPRYYGYGGSGYAVPEVNPREAREQCLYAARAFRGYRGVRAGSVAQTGPETARVRLFVGQPYEREYALECRYDARTGAAYVP
ncbi:hypothetical protein [Melittangium boletus]|uniref:Lipoprotein n=1 Tax=Melittangium boletus DSM 14713 TaxID=1294270 RepID=A0A250IEF0_9BACT|nr:hypothetical protein [Melittangium boletus]ATB29618.1 hypothetical protein MEBOL_003073 [Melittangium boletus DSM 14713]